MKERWKRELDAERAEGLAFWLGGCDHGVDYLVFMKVGLRG